MSNLSSPLKETKEKIFEDLKRGETQTLADFLQAIRT